MIFKGRSSREYKGHSNTFANGQTNCMSYLRSLVEERELEVRGSIIQYTVGQWTTAPIVW